MSEAEVNYVIIKQLPYRVRESLISVGLVDSIGVEEALQRWDCVHDDNDRSYSGFKSNIDNGGGKSGSEGVKPAVNNNISNNFNNNSTKANNPVDKPTDRVQNKPNRQKQLSLICNIEGKEFRHEFLVIPGLSTHIILGVDSLIKFKCILDFGRKVI